MKKMIAVFVLVFLSLCGQAQSAHPAQAPLRKDGVTVKRVAPSTQVAPRVVRKKRSLFRRKKANKCVCLYRVSICPSF